MRYLMEQLPKFQTSNDSIERIWDTASDNMDEGANYIFFYGKLADENEWILGHSKDANKIKSVCPNCGNLFKVRKPKNGEHIECPSCDQEGTMYDFRDYDTPCDELMLERYAVIEPLDKGYALRLFSASLDYSNRDYDDYTRLSYEPEINIVEDGREYWYNGNVEYYDVSPGAESVLVRVDSVYDGGYDIIGYDEPFNPMFDSTRIEDIIYDTKYDTFAECLSKKMSYKVFTTLKKYGFERLSDEYIYFKELYPADSNKISEVLQLDINKLKSEFNLAEIGSWELVGLRQLSEYNIELTKSNLGIAIVLDDRLEEVLKHQPVKTFKYLRHISSGKKAIIKDYIDYITACKKLNIDMDEPNRRTPSNFKKAHDDILTLIKLQDVEMFNIHVETMYDRYHKFCEWKDDECVVIMPKNCTEIINEGIRQNHCVGHYCERVAKGESIILFLRRKTAISEAFYTMEIRPDMKKLNVIQCRGYHNEDKSEEDAKDVTGYLARYEQWFNKRSIKGFDPNRVTAKYYKAVKLIDGKLISARDSNTEYKVGEIIETECDPNPDKVAVCGIHIASLEFAVNFGKAWHDVVILEMEVNLNDVIVPDAKDQIRASRAKVLRIVSEDEVNARVQTKVAQCS